MKVGLTGGIGSGKSFVAKRFEIMGVPVYYADKEAKRLMYQDQLLKADIKDLLGVEAYHRNGRLNRPYIAQKIFKDKTLLTGINGLVHPKVKLDFEEWANKQQSNYVLEESAIIFENKMNHFDATVLVIAPKAIRLQRVMKRDGITRKQVENRMNQQLPDEKKLKLADYVIENDGTSISNLDKQIKEIHKSLLLHSKHIN